MWTPTDIFLIAITFIGTGGGVAWMYRLYQMWQKASEAIKKRQNDQQTQLEHQNDQLARAIRQGDNRISALGRDLKASEERSDRWEQRVHRLESEIQILKAQINNQNDQLTDKDRRIAQLETQDREKTAKINEQNVKINEQEAEISRQAAKIVDLENRLNHTRQISPAYNVVKQRTGTSELTPLKEREREETKTNE